MQPKKVKEGSLPAIKVIVGGNDFDKKAMRLKNLINDELTDKLNLVKHIDLRFKKVYVGFKR